MEKHKNTYRVVIWNCAQALHEKYDSLLDLSPDIAIIPECANTQIIAKKAPNFKFNEMIWDGRNPNKGLGVFSFGKNNLQKSKSLDEKGYIFLPIIVTGRLNFNLLAVWAFNHRNPHPNSSNITTSNVISLYKDFICQGNSLVAGDFNHNTIWDSQSSVHKFRETLDLFEALDLRSAYHQQHQEVFGEESLPTFYWQRNIEQPYHIDYAFLSSKLIDSNYSYLIGNPSKYLPLSDHMPICLDLGV